jgi:CrcB protein
MVYLAIAVGAALGANLRYLVGVWVAVRFGTELPYGTFIVNVSGSFAIGIVLAVLMERLDVDPIWRSLLVTGFLGGYTTFSSYAWETLRLTDSGAVFAALLYVAASTVVGIGAAAVGAGLVRLLAH